METGGVLINGDAQYPNEENELLIQNSDATSTTPPFILRAFDSILLYIMFF